MLCQSCGAPMVLMREREYFFCEYCGSYHFPTASNSGIRLLGEAPDGLKCPVCRARFHLASMDGGRVRGYQCPQCRGLLLNRADFGDTVQTRRAAATEPADPPRPLDRSELTRRVHCPRCSRLMSTHPYMGPGNIVIDTCDVCHLIWLDHAELERTVNAPGFGRGTAHRPSPPPPLYTSAEIGETSRHRSRTYSLAALLEEWLFD